MSVGKAFRGDGVNSTFFLVASGGGGGGVTEDVGLTFPTVGGVGGDSSRSCAWKAQDWFS